MGGSAHSKRNITMAGRVFRPLCIFAVLLVMFWLIGLAVHRSCSFEHSLNISFANTNFHVVYRWRWRSLANKYRLRHSVIKSTKHGSTSLALASRPFVMDLTVCMDISRNPGPNNVAYVRTKLNIVHNFTCGSYSTLRSDDFDYNHSRLSSYNNVIGNCVESWPLYFGVNSHAYNSFAMGLAGTYTQEMPSTSSIPVIIRERPAIITKPVIRARNNLLQISLNRTSIL